MSVNAVKIICDAPVCGAYYQVEAASTDEAREIAADRWGWYFDEGEQTDICAPCQRGDAPEPNEELDRERTAASGALDAGELSTWARHAVREVEIAKRIADADTPEPEGEP